MNKQRRKQIEDVKRKIEELREEVETIRDEEQEYYDNMPESIQLGEKGDQAEYAISYLDEVIEALDGCETPLEDAAQ